MRSLTLGWISLAIALAADTTPNRVTFYKDVLPVIQQNCQACHRAGEAAPMAFTSYESTRPWAKAIKAAVLTKKMPPWFADPHYGKFANDRTLPRQAMNILVAWADSGAPAGDVKDAPPPPKFADGWAMPEPEAIIEMPAAFDIPASGTIDYQYIVIPTNFKQDRYVQAAEARPGDRSRVHHIIAFIREPGSPWLKEAKPGVPFVPPADSRANLSTAEFLAGYAPGLPPEVIRPGQAKLLRAGSDIVLQMHYTADGKPGRDRSRVGLVFAKQKPSRRLLTLAAADDRFVIPPGDGNYRVDSKITLASDTLLTSLLPHMHLRGKDFEYRAVYPSGEKEVLLRVPKYDFNWQLTYSLAEPKLLPAGTTIECTAHFDNSANNPANPDPTKEVRFGEQSWDEMMIGFFNVAIDISKDPRELFKKPETRAEVRR